MYYRNKDTGYIVRLVRYHTSHDQQSLVECNVVGHINENSDISAMPADFIMPTNLFKENFVEVRQKMIWVDVSLSKTTTLKASEGRLDLSDMQTFMYGNFSKSETPNTARDSIQALESFKNR